MKMRRVLKSVLMIVFVGLVGVAATGCGPTFPNCETNEDCQTEEGQEQNRLVCVNGLCQECQEDADCDEGMQCSAGACEEIPGYCESDDDCDGDQVCRDNRCGPECTSDDECGDNEMCQAGSCVEETECTADADCADQEECQEGQCVEAAGDMADCTLETIYFGYDTATLSQSARDTLEQNAECIEAQDLDVTIAGHADERGSNEYNIALGERRANSVYDYMESLGVPTAQMDTISYGEERLARQCGIDGSDDCHEENRRVTFERN